MFDIVFNFFWFFRLPWWTFKSYGKETGKLITEKEKVSTTFDLLQFSDSIPSSKEPTKAKDGFSWASSGIDEERVTWVQVRNAIGEKNLSRAALPIVYDTKILQFSETGFFTFKYSIMFLWGCNSEIKKLSKFLKEPKKERGISSFGLWISHYFRNFTLLKENENW